MTQIERINKYLDDFGSITSFEAFIDLGIVKLSNRISEMIQMGEKINKTPIYKTNRYGEKVRLVRYTRA